MEIPERQDLLLLAICDNLNGKTTEINFSRPPCFGRSGVSIHQMGESGSGGVSGTVAEPGIATYTRVDCGNHARHEMLKINNTNMY